MTRTTLLNCPINFNFNLILIYSIFTALVETKVSHIKHIHIYIYKENLAKLHKRTINYILKKKKLLQWGRTRREHTDHSS